MKIWKFLAIAMIIPAANKIEALPVQAEEAPYRAAPSFLPFSYTDDSIFPDPDMISFPGKEEQLYFISLKEQAGKYGGMQGMISDQDESPGVCWASMADFWGSGDQVFAIVYRSAGEEKDAVKASIRRLLRMKYGVEAEDFVSHPVVLEANYRDPAFSGLLRARMQDAGAKYLPGQLWLVNQAVSGYSVMTGEAPDIDSLISL